MTDQHIEFYLVFIFSRLIAKMFVPVTKFIPGSIYLYTEKKSKKIPRLKNYLYTICDYHLL